MGAKTAIGLDIGTSAVRAAEVQVKGGNVRLLRFGQVGLPPGAVVDGQVVDDVAVTAALKALWKGAKLKGTKVMLGVANQHVSVRQATLPWMPPDEFATSLRFQAADLVPIPIDSAVVDFVPVRETQKDNERLYSGLLVVASQDVILDAIAVAKAAGLSVVGVDLSAFAVMRAVVRPEAVAGQPEAIVDIGARVTHVVIHQDGVPLFVRVLLTGGLDVTRALCESLNIDMAAAELLKRSAGHDLSANGDAARAALAAAMARLVEEVRGSLDYYQASTPGPHVGRIVLSGGASQAHGLALMLSQHHQIPVVAARPFATLDTTPTGLSPVQIAFAESSAAVPVGLALGGVR